MQVKFDPTKKGRGKAFTFSHAEGGGGGLLEVLRYFWTLGVLAMLKGGGGGAQQVFIL